MFRDPGHGKLPQNVVHVFAVGRREARSHEARTNPEGSARAHEGGFMFSRHITMQIKKNLVSEFPKVIEKEILPLLRRQKGFLDELVLMAPDKTEVVAISLWETKEFAETYQREFYPEVVKILDKYIEGLPAVKTFDVEFATLPAFQKFATVALN
jgi:heme-degrading monooxygenase HmoA